MEEWQDPDVIIVWISLGTIFLLILLAFIIILTRLIIKNIVAVRIKESILKLDYQLRLTKSTINAQEQERERIAADIHDELIGKLNAIKLKCEIGNDFRGQEFITNIDESIQCARRISHDLSPPLIEYVSLPDIIVELVEPYHSCYVVRLRFDKRVKINFDAAFKLQFLRIVQEVLVNIHKHACASHIKFNYKLTAKFLMILISDDGTGFEINNLKSGLGLQNIETRVQYLEGKYKLRSTINKGTTIFLVFPTPKLISDE
jgi:signal transduction histidine kinase